VTVEMFIVGALDYVAPLTVLLISVSIVIFTLRMKP
jgi:hypothetical protein